MGEENWSKNFVENRKSTEQKKHKYLFESRNGKYILPSSELFFEHYIEHLLVKFAKLFLK